MVKRNTADRKLIKKINTNAILNIIRSKGPISRADIAKMLSLNPATVSSNVVDLLDLGIIREIGSGDSSGGRKPILLELDYDNVYVMGVHTELTHVNIGIVDLKGKVIVKRIYPFGTLKDDDGQQILQTVKEGIDDILNSSNVQKEKIMGIGVGLHGLVDTRIGESVFAPAFHWHHLGIKDWLYERYNIPIIVDNDVRAMALGEKWFGNAKSSENFILINIGEGIGGALFIDGRLYSGKSFGAGEIGHIKVTHQPIKCDCGNMGCLTTIASEEAILNEAKKTVDGIDKLESKTGEELTLEKLLSLAKEGNKEIANIFKRAGDYIGTGIGIIINIINPEAIILTGTVLKAKEMFFDNIINRAKSASIIDNFSKTEILVSSIEEDLGVIGASTLIFEDLFTIM